MTKGDAPNRKLGYLYTYTILIASFLFWKLNLKADFGWKLLHIRIICRTINKYFAPTVMSKLSLQVFQNSVWKKNNKDYVATPYRVSELKVSTISYLIRNIVDYTGVNCLLEFPVDVFGFFILAKLLKMCVIL